MNETLVYDTEQLKRFHAILSANGLAEDEAYFVSLSARKKYLTDEERKNPLLKNAEMFARKLVKDNTFETYLRKVKSLDSYTEGIPTKALVVYAQINPVSGKNALRLFYEKTHRMLFENTLDQMNKLDSVLMTCYQQSRGANNLLDIDFDTKDMYYVNEYTTVLRMRRVTHHVIETKSGYHVLLDKSTVKFNYTKDVQRLHSELTTAAGTGEIVVNKNQMIPAPGTLQGGHEVRFL